MQHTHDRLATPLAVPHTTCHARGSTWQTMIAAREEEQAASSSKSGGQAHGKAQTLYPVSPAPTPSAMTACVHFAWFFTVFGQTCMHPTCLTSQCPARPHRFHNRPTCQLWCCQCCPHGIQLPLASHQVEVDLPALGPVTLSRFSLHLGNRSLHPVVQGSGLIAEPQQMLVHQGLLLHDDTHLTCQCKHQVIITA